MEARAEQSIQEKYQLLGAIFNERERRLWAAVEARQLGRGRGSFRHRLEAGSCSH
jgi:hypothetical protein